MSSAAGGKVSAARCAGEGGSAAGRPDGALAGACAGAAGPAAITAAPAAAPFKNPRRPTERLLIFAISAASCPGRLSRFYSTCTWAGELETSPTVTTTGCAPFGMEAGKAMFTCAKPMTPGATPANSTKAGMPATVADNGRSGLGRFAMEVPLGGDKPVLSEGETSPTPTT